jgi:hypothetical protein
MPGFWQRANMSENRVPVEPTLNRVARLSVALFCLVVILVIAIETLSGSRTVFLYVFIGAVLTYVAGGLYTLKKVIEHN